MANITLRIPKGIALTHQEIDDNFNNLNLDKIERVLDVNDNQPALRITQRGAGNALVVEDSDNPDATPFVIDADGNVLCSNELRVGAVSTTETYPSVGNRTPLLQLKSSANALSAVSARYSANSVTGAPSFILAKSRASNSVVLNGDTLGTFSYVGHDGTAFIEAANIQAFVDGTPSTNDMPGRLVFSTTADGGSTPTERMRIDSAGRIGIGDTPTAGNNLIISSNLTGATIVTGIALASTIQPDATTAARYIDAYPSTAANGGTPYTVPIISIFSARQGTFNPDSTVTTQYGFAAQTSLIGATNNYGFYGNIPSGTGRWNFYANGTAPNYFAGNVGIGKTTPEAKLDVLADSTEPAVRITQTGTGNAFVVEDSASPDATPFVIDSVGRVISGHTDTGGSNSGNFIAHTLGITELFDAVNWNTNGAATPRYTTKKSVSGSIGSFTGNLPVNTRLMDLSAQGDNGTAFTESARIRVETEAVSSGAIIPSRITFAVQDALGVLTERFRIDSEGRTRISDRLGIGGVIGNNRRVALLGNSAPQASGFSFGIDAVVAVQSDLTGRYTNYTSNVSTQAAAFTLGNLWHYNASQSTIGAGSTVTNQIGFNADSSLIGATNNYGFYGNISSGTGRWNFYANGTADNYFAGTTWIGSTAGVSGLSLSSGTSGQQCNLNANSPIGGQLDLNYIPADGVGNATIRLFRSTNTTGTASLQVLLGDGTSTHNHILHGKNNQNSFLCSNNGNVVLGNSSGFVGNTGVSTVNTSPVNSNVSATLAASTIVSGIATGTPAAGINFTLPTGTNLDAVVSSLPTNQTFEWSVINLAAATHAITVLTNTNHTVVGNMVVAANTSGRFASRKTASGVFITYRLA